MATSLSRQTERLIADRLAGGKFESGDAVVAAALDALDWLDERKAAERAWLDDKLARAVAEADRGDSWIDAAEFEARMEARFDALSKKIAA